MSGLFLAIILISSYLQDVTSEFNKEQNRQVIEITRGSLYLLRQDHPTEACVGSPTTRTDYKSKLFVIDQ